MKDSSRQRFWSLLEPVYDDLAALGAQLTSGDGGDLLQDVILKVMDKLPGLKEEQRFKAWMARIMIREARRRRRRRFLKGLLGLDDVPERVHTADQPDPEGTHLRRLHLKSALHHLKADRREVLLLHYLGGFSLKEIAELGNESLSAVKTRISRARREVKTLMEGGLPLAAISLHTEKELDHGFQRELEAGIADESARECA